MRSLSVTEILLDCQGLDECYCATHQYIFAMTVHEIGALRLVASILDSKAVIRHEKRNKCKGEVMRLTIHQDNLRVRWL